MVQQVPLLYFIVVWLLCYLSLFLFFFIPSVAVAERALLTLSLFEKRRILPATICAAFVLHWSQVCNSMGDALRLGS